MDKEEFNKLLDLLIISQPNSQRFCCLRKYPVPVTKLTDFDCVKCELFVLNGNNPDANCDPL